MTYKQFRKKMIKLSTLIHRAYSEGRIKTAEYLQDKFYNLAEQYPDFLESN